MSAAITALVRAIVAKYQECPQSEADKIVSPNELLSKLFTGPIEASDVNELVQELENNKINLQIHEAEPDSFTMVYSLKIKTETVI